MTESAADTAYAALPDNFRAMMSAFPTGIAVVTTTDVDGRPHGMTCSSVCSVTLEPPTLLVCLRAASPTLHAILRAGVFAVNLLHKDGESIARLFSSGLTDRFHVADWSNDGRFGLPHFGQDAHVVADCRVSRTDRMGDHTIVFGQAEHITRHDDRPPLLYGLRQYQSWPTR